MAQLTQEQKNWVEQRAREIVVQMLTEGVFPGLPAGKNPRDHANLTNLSWVNSGHDGPTGMVAGFDDLVPGVAVGIPFQGSPGGGDEIPAASDTRITPHEAAAAPTVNDDVDQGFKVGSEWLDTTGPDWYKCADNTNGAAVWVLIS